MRKDIGERLKSLRETIHVSQSILAKELGSSQANIYRYEHGESAPNIELLIKYADYFNVSLDYICCRTSKPQGKLYEHHSKIKVDKKEMQEFIEMCFDPASPANESLKTALIRLWEEGNNE